MPQAVIFVFLRGGADALSMLVPFAEPIYYCARPRTAIGHPKTAKVGAARCVDLDGRFGLHPALAPLLPLWKAREVRFVVGTGIPYEAPKTLEREPPPAPPPSHFTAARALDSALASATQGRLTLEAHGHDIEARLTDLGNQSARSEKPSSALVDMPGWDIHAQQGNADGGRLYPLLSSLAQGVVAFRTAVGDALSTTRLVVVTEFGRGLWETPLGGTDDGEASLTMILGPRTASGGRVLGQWAGLSPAQLREGRHLPITTDLRATLARVCRGEPEVP